MIIRFWSNRRNTVVSKLISSTVISMSSITHLSPTSYWCIRNIKYIPPKTVFNELLNINEANTNCDAITTASVLAVIISKIKIEITKITRKAKKFIKLYNFETGDLVSFILKISVLLSLNTFRIQYFKAVWLSFPEYDAHLKWFTIWATWVSIITGIKSSMSIDLEPHIAMFLNICYVAALASFSVLTNIEWPSSELSAL